MNLKKRLAIILALTLLMSLMPGAGILTAYAAPNEEKGNSGTWFETAFAEWVGAPETSYSVAVRTLGAYDWRDNSKIESSWLADWTPVDKELIRLVNPARSTWRVDIPGLPRGEYEIQVSSGSSVIFTFDGLETWSFVREGAAFDPSSKVDYGGQLPLLGQGSSQSMGVGSAFTPFLPANDRALDGATGGYLADGRVNPEAKIVYVTHENMETSMPANLFTSGRGTKDNATPLVLRFLGTVGSLERVAQNYQTAGAQVPIGARNNNRMVSVAAGWGNITFEGIGTDAIIDGWGIGFSAGNATNNGTYNIVFRNLTIDRYLDDGITMNGTAYSWIHNVTFGVGQNRYLTHVNADHDHSKGDGAIDFTNGSRNYTVSYVHFAGSAKSMANGGNWQHHGTLFHNWFQGTEERTPRASNVRSHIYNNLYTDNQGHDYHDGLWDRRTGYGIGAANNATIWAEGNIFDNVNFPILRSRMGHARGHAGIDYTPDPSYSKTFGQDEAPRFEGDSQGRGHNHFYGDGPGYVITREAVLEGNWPKTLDDFVPLLESGTYPYLQPGMTQEDLDRLTADALALQPNIIMGNVVTPDPETGRTIRQPDNDASYFDVSQDIGIIVDPRTRVTTNPGYPNVTNVPNSGSLQGSKLDWGFRMTTEGPNAPNVWPTETPEQVATLREHIETWVGAQKPPVPEDAPLAPTIKNVAFNDQTMSVIAEYRTVPVPVIREDTFTISWASNDATADTYEIQWVNPETGEWETLAVTTTYGTQYFTARNPNTFVTQKLDPWAAETSYEPLATALNGRDALYAFRIRGVNAAGESEWSDIYVLNGFEDDTARAKLSGDSIVTVNDVTQYVVSVANTNKLATATLWFEVDGEYFAGKDVTGLNGFDVLGGIQWTQVDGTLWSGRVTLTNMSGGITSKLFTDIFKLTLEAKEELGDTEVKLTRIDLSGYGEDGKAVFFESIITNGKVDTEIAEYVSPYDVNRDGSVDQLDLTTAQLYFAVREGDINWDDAKIADINGDGRIDIEDLILILNHIVW